MNYAALFGSAGGGAAAGGWTQIFTSSASVTFTEAGTVCLSVVGAGGGGAAASGGSGTASGGNSGPWGRKKFKVVASDVLAVTLGAGGLKAASAATDGAQGSTTTVTLNGVTILTVQGGEGGVYVAGSGPAQPIAPAATVTGADYSRSGVRAGSATNTGAFTGGAAVDILSNGTGKSPNATGAAGVGGSVGVDTGGSSLAWLALTEFGVAITDPNAASTTNTVPGRGGAAGAVKAGAFAGGGSNTATEPVGGYGGGGGGGGSAASNGNGGPAFASLTFTPEA